MRSVFLLLFSIAGLALGAACGGDAAPSGAPAPAVTNAETGPPSGAPSSSSPAASPSASPSTPPPNQPPAATCAGKSAAKAGNVTVSVTSNGERTSKLHIPGSYDSTKAEMLVLNFHGYFGDAGGEEAVTKMDGASDQHGFLVAYPQGIGNSWNAGLCCGDAVNGHVDDVAFVKALIAKLESDYCIDEKRIYTTGMSNGGHISYRLACEMSDVFAAAAPVAGQLLEASCTPKRQIPILHIHGTADPIVAYDGGGYRSTAASLGVFQTAYGCGGVAKTNWYSKGDATCYSFDGCPTEVAHCKIDGGGHTWPGGMPLVIFGKTSTDLDATETIISFFEKHPNALIGSAGNFRG